MFNKLAGERILVDKNVLHELFRIVLGNQLTSRGGLAGQAFTEYVCLHCEEQYNHPNTACPSFCRDCTKYLMEKFSR